MQSNFAKLAILAMNTVRLNEASKLLGSPDESATVLSTLCPLFEAVIDANLKKCMEEHTCGLSEDDDVGVEYWKFDAPKSENFIVYKFVLTGNFRGCVELNFTICTDPTNIHFHMTTAAMYDNGDILEKKAVSQAEIRGLPTALPYAVSEMMEVIKKDTLKKTKKD